MQGGHCLSQSAARGLARSLTANLPAPTRNQRRISCGAPEAAASYCSQPIRINARSTGRNNSQLELCIVLSIDFSWVSPPPPR